MSIQPSFSKISFTTFHLSQNNCNFVIDNPNFPFPTFPISNFHLSSSDSVRKKLSHEIQQKSSYTSPKIHRNITPKIGIPNTPIPQLKMQLSNKPSPFITKFQPSRNCLPKHATLARARQIKSSAALSTWKIPAQHNLSNQLRVTFGASCPSLSSSSPFLVHSQPRQKDPRDGQESALVFKC